MMKSIGAIDDNTIVVSTVHECQVMDIPESIMQPHDVLVNYIVTPDEIIKCDCKQAQPSGVMWSLLTPEKMQKIPVLKRLRILERQAGKNVTLKDEAEFDDECEDEEEEERDNDRYRRRQPFNRRRRNPRQRRRTREGEGDGDDEDTKGSGDASSDHEASGNDNRSPNQRPRRRRRFQRRRRPSSNDKENDNQGSSENAEDGGRQEGRRDKGDRRNNRRDGRRNRRDNRDRDDRDDRDRKDDGEEHDDRENNRDRRDRRGPPRRFGSARRTRMPTLFVGSIPRALRVSELKTKVRDLEVTPIRVIWHGARGYAFFQFTKNEEMSAALDVLRDIEINGRKLRIEEANAMPLRGRNRDDTGDEGDVAANED